MFYHTNLEQTIWEVGVSTLLNIGVNEAFERVALETKRRLLGEDKVGEEKDKSSIKLNGVNVNVNKGSCCK